MPKDDNDDYGPLTPTSAAFFAALDGGDMDEIKAACAAANRERERQQEAARTAPPPAPDSTHAFMLRHLVKREQDRLERMQIYRAAADEAMDSCAEEEALGQLLAYATTLARGGEISHAMNVAKVAGVIARAAKNNALLHASSAQFVQNVQENEKSARDPAMIFVSTSGARADLAKLIESCLQGDTVVLERHGRPVVKLARYTNQDRARAAELALPPHLRAGAQPAGEHGVPDDAVFEASMTQEVERGETEANV